MLLAELLGESPGIAAVRGQLERLLRHRTGARRLPPILIQGETGTGKGLLARGVHRAGPRQGGPFVDVNCAAIPETLLEAEMFGFERGAFTDARQAKAGLLQAAHRGTIFLDEVGLLPEALQAKLLKAIEEQAIRRLGSTRSEPVNVWILAATSEDLGTAVRERRFREDLYHRLAVVTVHLPPLRARGQDVVRLAEHFLARVCTDYQLEPKRLDLGAQKALATYQWPGNVRELANLMERVALLSEGAVVTAEMLGVPEAIPGATREAPPPEGPVALDDAVEDVERVRVLDALQRTNWNISQAAALLDISRNRLRYRIERQGLRRRPKTSRARSVRTAEPPSGAAAPLATAGPPALRWERRRLAILRADLIALHEAVSPGDSSRLLEMFVDKLHGFGGRMEELSSSGIVAVFGLEPVEDAPRRAALSAMAILKTVEADRRDGREEYQIRIGIHSSQFMVGRIGPAVQLEGDGKRDAWAILGAMLAGGEPDGILVSAAAAAFLEREFSLEQAGRSGEAPAVARRLVGRQHAGLGPSGRITSFVGRSAELELLKDRLAVATTGQGQVVGIVGEPGIGKSRLLSEFRRSLPTGEVSYLEGRCFSYATVIPYFPVSEILRTGCGVSDADSPEVIIEKVRQRLPGVGMEPAEGAPYLLHLLGIKEGSERLAVLSADAVKSRTFQALWEMIVEQSRRRPLVLVVEDVHWIDSASEAFLAWLVGRVPGAPLLLLVTYRAGHRPPEMEKSYVTQVALPPLSRQDSLKIVHAVLDPAQVSDPVAPIILARAEGNPLFLEELARVVSVRRERPLPTVPETLEEVLLARIDRLPEAAKQLLQTASVLGRECPLGLLSAICDPALDLDHQLRELTRLEFLFLRSATLEPVYAFRHALMWEVAYQSLLVPQRQALHAAIGRALETMCADRLDEAYDRLAYHYSRTEDAGKAVEYLTRFAERAARASAYLEAIAALRDALVHAERLSDDRERQRLRVDLILRQAYPLSLLGRFQEVIDLLLAERERVERLGNSVVTGTYYFWLGRTYGVLGNHDRAVEAAERALEEATRCGEKTTMGKAHYVLGYEDYWSGRARSGLERGRQAVSLLEETEERFWLGLAHWIVAINFAHIGEFDRALEAVARARVIGEAIGDPGLRCTAAWSSGMIYGAQGEYEAAIEACQLALECSPNPVNTALAMGFLGGSHLENGDATRAIPLLEQSAQLLGQFHVRQTRGWFLALLGEAYLLNRDLDQAEEFARQGLEISREACYQYGSGAAQRALGRIAQARGSLAEAEAHFTEAHDTFASVDARFEEARTHLAQADLARAEDDVDRTSRHLKEALRLFKFLRITKYVERAEAVAQSLPRARSVDEGDVSSTGR